MNPSELERFFVRPEQTLLQVMECVNKNARGIALVVDRERRLLDTITDGDPRRAVLAAKDLQQSAGCFRGQPYQPITAPLSSTPHQLLALMRQHKLRHIPLLEPKGVVADMALMETLVEHLNRHQLSIPAIIEYLARPSNAVDAQAMAAAILKVLADPVRSAPPPASSGTIRTIANCWSLSEAGQRLPGLRVKIRCRCKIL